MENGNLENLIGITIGGQKTEEDLHGMLFDEKTLVKGLEDVGFCDIKRYNWWETSFYKNDDFDDYSSAYIPERDMAIVGEQGDKRLMMLNLKARKISKNKGD